MIKIEIHSEVEDYEEAIDLLNFIATKIKEGKVYGSNPDWELIIKRD